jgi:hypothetical protein
LENRLYVLTRILVVCLIVCAVFISVYSAHAYIHPEIIDIVATGSDKQEPDIAFNPNTESTLVVWAEADGEIRCRILYPNESISSDIVLHSGDDEGLLPQAAASATGGYWIVVWEVRYSAWPGIGIYGAKVTDSGSVTFFSVEEDLAESNQHPDVGVDLDTGLFLFVWTDPGDLITGSRQIKGRIYNGTGSYFESDEFLIKSSGITNPKMKLFPSVNQQGHGLLVAWEVDEDYGDRRIHGRYVTTVGTNPTPNSSFEIYQGKINAHIDVAADDQSPAKYLVVWHHEYAPDDWDIKYAYCSSTGVTLSGDVAYQSDRMEYRPTAAFTGVGTQFFVAFAEAVTGDWNNWDIYGRSLSTSGSRGSRETIANTSNPEGSPAATFVGGLYSSVYLTWDEGTNDIHAREYSYYIPWYEISGYVLDDVGDGIQGVTMNGLSGNPSTDVDGFYQGFILEHESITVIPTKTGYSFSPSSRSYSGLRQDQTSENYLGITNSYSISGYIRDSENTPIAGVLLSGLPSNPLTSSSGYYSSLVPFGWSGTVAPVKSAYVFTPSERTYSSIDSDWSGQDYTATNISTYTISGHVRDGEGQAISGVVVGGLPSAPTSDNNGYYSDVVPHGWSGTATPQKSGYSFTPTNLQYSNVTTHMTDQNFTGVISTYFTISGYIRFENGQGISGVWMIGLPNSPYTDSNGYYSDTIPYGWSGSVIPQKSGFSFAPSSQPYSNITSDLSGQNYTGTTTETVNILGVIDSNGDPAGVVMQGLPGNPVTTSAWYWFVVPLGWSGTVTPMKDKYAFEPASRTYTDVTVEQLDQNYTATTQAICGYVRDINGDGIQGVTMSGLPGSPITSSSGYYWKEVDYNWSGSVTPLLTSYTFTPTDRSYVGVTSTNRDQDYVGVIPADVTIYLPLILR